MGVCTLKYFKSFQSYRQAWDRAFEKDPSIPLNLDIELSAVCNLRCPFCPLSNPNWKAPKEEFIQVIQAIKIIAKANEIGVPALKFNWMGEPTLHPAFNIILEYAASKDFYDLLVNTNGNYKPEKNEGLMYATKVMFSVDSMIPNIYKQLRRNGDLFKVFSNIEDLLKRGHKNIVVRRVITPQNKKENFAEIVKTVFGNKVQVSEHYVFDRNPAKKYQKKKATEFKRIYCGYPSQRLVIDTQLNVFPCCVDYNKVMKLGNLKRDSIMDIWNSRKLQTIRDKLRQNKMPSRVCKNCTSWASYDSEYRKAVFK